MRREPRAIDPGILLLPLLIPFIPAIVRILTPEPEAYTIRVKIDGEEREITVTKEELEELKKKAA